MKKAWYLPLIAMVLTACNNSEAPNEQEKSEGTVRNFLSVNILSASATRDVDPDDYETGSESENQINSVRFYFFDGNGKASLVRKQGGSEDYLSYIDWIPTQVDIDNTGNVTQTVEKILTATLGINMPATSSLPELVLAVLNPTQEILSIPGNPSLDDLRAIVNNYGGLTNKNFVITNSVYADEESELVTATPIDGENFKATAEEASQNAVNIFVERVVARLDLSIAMTPVESAAGTIYKLGNKTYSIDGENPTSLYVKLLGWNVTATTTTSRLVKSINPGWDADLFGDGEVEPWNIYQLHRSFWAINPESVGYEYGPFTTEEDGTVLPNTADGLQIPVGNNTTSVYLQENANPYSTQLTAAPTDNPSKVILAAQLVNENGQTQEIIRWANRYYTIDGALIAITNSLNLYTKSTVGGVTQYDKITPSDLTFVSAYDMYPDGLPDDVADYFVYVQLSTTVEEGEEDEVPGAEKTWYNGNTQSSPALTTEKANEYILNVINNVLYWNNGYAYYYLDIYHLGAEGSTAGYVGVVRNHIYKAKVTGIAGLGTPVYDPDLTIYPEMPGYDDSVLSANINILQWRIVASQEYSFEWP